METVHIYSKVKEDNYVTNRKINGIRAYQIKQHKPDGQTQMSQAFLIGTNVCVCVCVCARARARALCDGDCLRKEKDQ